MKAALITEQGPASNLQTGEVPDPVDCGAAEVLIAVTASAVNPIDTYLRSGSVGGELPQPWIPGCDFAGQVIAVGDDVTDFAVGDRVWGSNQSLAGRQGTLAEKIAVDQQWVYHTPQSVSDESAAAGALTGITAHLGLHLHARLQAAETVFVNGGTGGVGSAVVQLAGRAGARVITTVGDDQKEATARELGADIVLNYRRPDLREVLEQAARQSDGIDVWFETLRTPEPETTIPLMARRGRMVVMAGRDARPLLPIGPLYVNDLRIVGFAMFNATADEQRESAEAINRAAVDDACRPLIGRRFSLEEAAAAHQLQEENTLHGAGTLTGKIVVQIGD